MFATLIVIAFIGACYGQFAEDMVTSILKTTSKGIERSRMAGNKRYQLFIQWQDENSRLVECKYCHFEDNETIRQYTDDIRKYNYETEAVVFPTTNSDINKQRVLIHIFKDFVELFDLEIQLNGDTCCHYFTFIL